MKNLLIIISLALAVNFAHAQSNNAFNLYATNPFLINPSLVGAKANTNIFTHYRNQYSGFSGAPVFQVLSLDHKVSERKFGLGLKAFNQKAGILAENGLQIAYAYNLDLNADWKLNFGLAANFSQRSIDFNSATVFEYEPSILEGNVSNTLFDGNFGMSLQREGLIIGLAIPNIMQSGLGFEGLNQTDFLSIQNRRAYELYVDYTWILSEKVNLQPVALFRKTSGGLFTYDLGAYLHFNNVVFAGLSYQSAYSASVSAGLKIKDGLTLVYSYSYPLNDISMASIGGHEVAIGYSFSPSKEIAAAKGKNKNSTAVNNDDMNLLKEQVYEQTKMNIRQREELERLKQMMKENDLESDLLAIKESSKVAVEKSTEGNIYYVVLGSFSKLETAQDYQKLLLRNEPSVRTSFVKSGNWVFVYAEKRTDASSAKSAALSLEQNTLSIEKPWIYVSKI